MIKKAQGFYEHFERKDGSKTKATHYCAGCGHGIIHKLIAEAVVDFGLQDDTVFVSPVGCGAFCYYYFDCGNVAAPHGRASAVATGLSRALPGKVVIAYQGDGDLGAIGFNNAFQAANRGEKFVCFFVNNAIYGMTGGQMAPTTLPGQKTATSPAGRDVATDGFPLKVCEVLNQLEAPVFIERVSVADTKRILKTKKAIRKALEIQQEGKGYAFVEILSPCPTNMKINAVDAAQWTIDAMEETFPLGNFRDRSDEAALQPNKIPVKPLDELVVASSSEDAVVGDFAKKEFKFCGFGGQGILSLGLVLAHAGNDTGKNVSWFPSYGPEQRGGTASCSVVLTDKDIGSPTVDKPDVLVAMNQPSLEKFAPTVKAGGVIIYDAQIPVEFELPKNVSVYAFPAAEIATSKGVPKAANTALLGSLIALDLIGLPEDAVLTALKDSFAKKPKLIPKNMEIVETAKAWMRENH
ncbi:MAG: ketoisovalerate oxidoreductase [Desulfobulbaceae bacterium]|nr:ketoisovalerate oxidoreductase [Desulfobulbaceae bacterium]